MEDRDIKWGGERGCGTNDVNTVLVNKILKKQK